MGQFSGNYGQPQENLRMEYGCFETHYVPVPMCNLVPCTYSFTGYSTLPFCEGTLPKQVGVGGTELQEEGNVGGVGTAKW